MESGKAAKTSVLETVRLMPELKERLRKKIMYLLLQPLRLKLFPVVQTGGTVNILLQRPLRSRRCTWCDSLSEDTISHRFLLR